MKTWSSQTTGVAAAGPGSGAHHLMFSVFENVVGRFFSVVEPLKNGPRHCGQFSARRDVVNRSASAPAHDNSLIVYRANNLPDL